MVYFLQDTTNPSLIQTTSTPRSVLMVLGILIANSVAITSFT